MVARWLLGSTLFLVCACGTVDEPADQPQVDDETIEKGLAGTVGVFMYREQSGEGSRFITALMVSFQEAAPTACQTKIEDFCTRQDCQSSHGRTDTRKLDAGRITATAGELSVSAEPNENGVYRVEFIEQGLWTGGEKIEIVAEGGSISGFSVTLNGPTPMLIADPPPPSADAVLSIPRESPFVVSWQENVNEKSDVLAVLSSPFGATHSSVTCTYPASRGAGAFSSGLLSDFNLDNEPMRLNIGIGQTQTIDADGWLVDVIAYTTATSGNQSDASYSVQFR